jgi:hypothetical protein
VFNPMDFQYYSLDSSQDLPSIVVLKACPTTDTTQVRLRSMFSRSRPAVIPMW